MINQKQPNGRGWFENKDPSTINRKGKVVARRHHEAAEMCKRKGRNIMAEPFSAPDKVIDKVLEDRNKLSIAIDNSRTANKVGDKSNADDLMNWAKNPNRSDLRDVDMKRKHIEDKSKSGLEKKFDGVKFVKNIEDKKEETPPKKDAGDSTKAESVKKPDNIKFDLKITEERRQKIEEYEKQRDAAHKQKQLEQEIEEKESIKKYHELKKKLGEVKDSSGIPKLKESYDAEIELYTKDQPEIPHPVSPLVLDTLDHVKFPKKGEGFSERQLSHIHRKLVPGYADIDDAGRDAYNTLYYSGAEKLEEDRETKAEIVLNKDMKRSTIHSSGEYHSPGNIAIWQEDYLFNKEDGIDLKGIDDKKSNTKK